MNLLRDEELVPLIAQSGGKWIFMGLESIDPGTSRVWLRTSTSRANMRRS
jgi:hypothetical protein